MFAIVLYRAVKKHSFAPFLSEIKKHSSGLSKVMGKGVVQNKVRKVGKMGKILECYAKSTLMGHLQWRLSRSRSLSELCVLITILVNLVQDLKVMNLCSPSPIYFSQMSLALVIF